MAPWVPAVPLLSPTVIRLSQPSPHSGCHSSPPGGTPGDALQPPPAAPRSAPAPPLHHRGDGKTVFGLQASQGRWEELIFWLVLSHLVGKEAKQLRELLANPHQMAPKDAIFVDLTLVKIDDLL